MHTWTKLQLQLEELLPIAPILALPTRKSVSTGTASMNCQSSQPLRTSAHLCARAAPAISVGTQVVRRPFQSASVMHVSRFVQSSGIRLDLLHPDATTVDMLADLPSRQPDATRFGTGAVRTRRRAKGLRARCMSAARRGCLRSAPGSVWRWPEACGIRPPFTPSCRWSLRRRGGWRARGFPRIHAFDLEGRGWPGFAGTGTR